MAKVDARIIVQIVVDIFLLILCFIPILLFYIFGDPFKRGFACNDTSIKFPYKDSTISATALYIYGTLIPFIMILVIEYIRAFRCNASEKEAQMNVWLWSVYNYMKAFIFGCEMSHIIVDVCKYSVGRLRPHFLHICHPINMDICDADHYAIVEGNICTEESDPELIDKQRESRLSFMSGHSSFAMYTMIFLILYLQARFHLRQFPLVKPILQQLCFVLALFTGLSRVMDYKHHWSDVFAGFLNGFIFAVLIAFFVAKLFQKKNGERNDDKRENLQMAENSGNDVFRHA